MMLTPSVRASSRLAATLHRCISSAPQQIKEDYPPPQDVSHTQRWQEIRQAKPFSTFLTDNHNRQHDYLRISLTERCNLRCLYCMPEEGVELSPNRDILTTPEIEYLSSVFVKQGVTKIRLTGGEPTVRKDILPLMKKIGDLRRHGLKELALTTNGISLHRKLDDMVESGLTGVNISLDTLDPFQYQILTRRQGFSAVMKSIDRVKEMNKLGAGIKLKVNCVVMRGLNEHQILPFVEMTRSEDIEVRFIEYMPFGGNRWSKDKMMSYSDMLALIQDTHPGFHRLQDARNDTSKTWQVPGFVGRVGFITSMTHNFCSTCNRLRITSDGNLKVCLHGNTEVSLRDMLRHDNGGEPMDDAAFEKLSLSDATARQRQLLDTVGAAVKRKKAKHAGTTKLGIKHQTITSYGVPLHLLPMSGLGLKSVRAFSTNLRMPSPRARQSPVERTRTEPGDALSVLEFDKPQKSSKKLAKARPAGALSQLEFDEPQKSPKKLAKARHTGALSQLESSKPSERKRKQAAGQPGPFLGLSSTDEDLISEFDERLLAAKMLGAREAETLYDPQSIPTQAQNNDILTPAEAIDYIDRKPQRPKMEKPESTSNAAVLTHLDGEGAAHMVDIGHKLSSKRIAVATAKVTFSNAKTMELIRANANKKGDVLAVARIAGLMASKKTSELIPLCHILTIDKANIGLALQQGVGDEDSILIKARIECFGRTGVEMEALTAVTVAGLTIIDMCKAVDTLMVMSDCKLVYKSGGKEVFQRSDARRVEHFPGPPRNIGKVMRLVSGVGQDDR